MAYGDDPDNPDWCPVTKQWRPGYLAELQSNMREFVALADKHLSVLDVLMKCPICGTVTRVGDCEPDCDGDGSLGCPVPDCGGICELTGERTREDRNG